MESELKNNFVKYIGHDSPLRKRLNSVLPKAGYTVTWEKLLPDMEIFRQLKDFQLIILHLHPDTRLQFLAFIKKIADRFPSINLMVLTPEYSLEESLAVIEAAGTSYLLDSTDTAGILKKIDQILQRRKMLLSHRSRTNTSILEYLSTALSHEIYNPLTAILGYSQLLMSSETPLPDDSKELIGIIENQAHRIKDIVRRLNQMRDMDLVEYLGGVQMANIRPKNMLQDSSINPKNYSILIADDEKPVRSLLKDILRSQGFNVKTAASGQEVLNKYNKTDFDLILLDIKMPDLSGLEVLRKLNQLPGATQVLMITGYLDDWEVDQAISEGAIGCLFKPFQIHNVLQAVCNAFDQTRNSH